MYIKTVKNKPTFGSLSVGDVFIYDSVPYIKIQPTCEQHQLKEGGVVLFEHNALNLSDYSVEWIDDYKDVEYFDSTLIIGKGKGEV